MSTIPNYEQAGQNTFRYVQQGGYRAGRGGSAKPGSFVALPEVIADRIGLRTHMGARLECAVLSRLLHEYQARSEGGRDIEFQGEEEPYRKRDGQFVLSIETVARDIWARWFHEKRTREDAAFRRFYERVRKSVGRLVAEGWVERHGHPLGRRCYGVVWSFVDTWFEGVDDLPHCPYQHVSLLRSGAHQDGYLGDGTRNVVDVIGGVFVADNPDEYRMGEMVTSLSVHGRGHWHCIYAWSRQVARTGSDGARFTSVGAWRPGEEGRADKPCIAPWVVFDIDREDDLQEAHAVTQRVLEQLEAISVPLEKVHVSFSGKKGFHIRVPSGVFGAPVFAGASALEGTLSTLTSEIADESLDLAVCNPRQNIRLIGSTRSNGAHVRAWRAHEFRHESLESILVASREHAPYQIGHIDPMSVAMVPEAVEMMAAAAEIGQSASIPAFHKTEEWNGSGGKGSVVRAALAGVATGEEWHESVNGKTYQGGSYAMFIACCHLLRTHDTVREAWEEALKVNQRYDPPFPIDHAPGQTLRGRFKSAVRTVRREGGRR